MDKRKLLAAVVAQLESDLAILTAAARSAREEATDEESRQEGKYDMRGQSAAYLAAGQAKLAAELAEAIQAYRALPTEPAPAGAAATVGSVLTVEANGKKSRYYLGPSRGGIEATADGEPILVVTTGSPLGRQLAGRRAGDPVSLPAGRAALVGKIVSVE